MSGPNLLILRVLMKLRATGLQGATTGAHVLEQHMPGRAAAETPMKIDRSAGSSERAPFVDQVFQSDHRFTDVLVIRCPEFRRITNSERDRSGLDGNAERFVRTVRSECLDWLLIMNAHHLESALAVFVDHCNRQRRPFLMVADVAYTSKGGHNPRACGEAAAT